MLTDLLVSTGAIKQWEEMDQIVEYLVGRSDNMTVFELAQLLKKEGDKSLAQLATDAEADRLQKAIRASRLGQQKICSQVIGSPQGPGQTPPPCVFQLFGQRYAIDSFVLSQVVYDSIAFHGGKPMRRMPSGLDVMFALGNDEAAPLLAEQLKRYNYSGNLLACRELCRRPGAFLLASERYNLRLNAIRALGDEPGAEAHFPHVMRTRNVAAETTPNPIGLLGGITA